LKTIQKIEYCQILKPDDFHPLAVELFENAKLVALEKAGKTVFALSSPKENLRKLAGRIVEQGASEARSDVGRLIQAMPRALSSVMEEAFQKK